MFQLILRESAIRIRVIYDFFQTCYTTFFTLVFECGYFNGEVPFGVLLAPVLLVLFNTSFGIYSKYRNYHLGLKLVFISTSVGLSSLCLGLLGVPSRWLSLWALLSWMPLVLPRLFAWVKMAGSHNRLYKTLNDRGPVLVVGGAGFIGTHVVDQILKSGRSVRVLDSLMYGTEPISEFIGKSNFEIMKGDATDIVKLLSALDGVSAVIHLGGLVGDPACSVDERFTSQSNVVATRMLKDAARTLGVPRFIFASSCSVYGSVSKQVDETSKLNPVSFYARTKIDSEKELLNSPAQDFHVTVLRFATVFGHSRRPRFDLVANLFTAQAMIEGGINVVGPNQWRPFVHVKDLAKTITAVLEAPVRTVSGQVFNVGHKKLNMTIGQLAERVKEITSSARLCTIVTSEDPVDTRNYSVSFDKLWDTLPLEPFTTIEEGILEMVEEFKKGTYKNYKESKYSNLDVTRMALPTFKDPLVSSKLYCPILSEDFRSEITHPILN